MNRFANQKKKKVANCHKVCQLNANEYQHKFDVS